MIPMPLRPQYATKTFSQVWPSYDDFKADYDALAPLIAGGVSPLAQRQNVQATYYLLYAKYANNPISNFDETQFKMKVMSNIATYGPAWEKKKAVQKTFRDLTESELLQGAKEIYNHANNPSTEPSTGTLEELTYINDQNTSNRKKSKMEAYGILWANLHVDATDEYIGKFRNCFSRFVGDQHPVFYIVEE